MTTTERNTLLTEVESLQQERTRTEEEEQGRRVRVTTLCLQHGVNYLDELFYVED
jgi:hypothetical protein